MLKHLSICAAFVALGTGPLYAQKQAAFLQTIEVPGVGFDLGSPDALVVHLMTLEEFEKFGNQRRLAAPNPEAGALPDLGSPDAMVVHLMTLEEFEKFENQRRPALVLNPNDTAEIMRAQASVNRSLP